MWICARFPRLPLEVLTRADSRDISRAVGDGVSPAACVLVCSDAARALGIVPGMRLAAAHALAGTRLQVLARDADAERAALAGIAAWSGQYTSFVSLDPPDAVLLEVAGSLRLFGGAERLMARIEAGLAALGYAPRLALAPTPLAATFIARAGTGAHPSKIPGARIVETAQLAAALAKLPLAVLRLQERPLTALHGMGLRSLGDVLRLPRAGLALRMTPGLVDLLDRALGRRPDPRTRHEPPPRYAARLDLPEDVESAPVLQFAAHRMLLELAGWLAAGCLGVEQVDWTLAHRRIAPTHITLGLAVPGRDPEHLLALLREHLDRLRLAEPVTGLALAADAVVPLAGHAGALFRGNAESAEQCMRLVERLRARLGTDAVHGLELVAQHRPEHAWNACPPGRLMCCGPSPGTPAQRAGMDLPCAERPLWLVAEPVPLAVREDGPCYKGRLDLVSCGERIENGWWDGQDVARDYYVARNAAGETFWVFHDLRGERGWFLHGIFE